MTSAISSNGCATSEDLFWKLDALQSFIRDLHWPDPDFGNHLNQRLKLMAADMIESSIQRYENVLLTLPVRCSGNGCCSSTLLCFLRER